MNRRGPQRKYHYRKVKDKSDLCYYLADGHLHFVVSKVENPKWGTAVAFDHCCLMQPIYYASWHTEEAQIQDSLKEYDHVDDIYEGWMSAEDFICKECTGKNLRDLFEGFEDMWDYTRLTCVEKSWPFTGTKDEILQNCIGITVYSAGAVNFCVFNDVNSILYFLIEHGKDAESIIKRMNRINRDAKRKLAKLMTTVQNA